MVSVGPLVWVVKFMMGEEGGGPANKNDPKIQGRSDEQKAKESCLLSMFLRKIQL